MWYRAHYYAGKRDPYAHTYWAESKQHAKDICKKLRFKYTDENEDFGIDEPAEFRPSRLVTLKGGITRPDFFHSLTFLTFLGLRSGVISDIEALADNSPLHILAHMRHLGFNPRDATTLAKGIKFLEDNVPGLPPKDMVLRISNAKYDDQTMNELRKQPFNYEAWLEE
jgi:hypothetical protein